MWWILKVLTDPVWFFAIFALATYFYGYCIGYAVQIAESDDG